MNKSDSIAKLAEALSKAQGRMKNAVKDSNNPYFKSKYADLAAVADACREELAANSLSVSHFPETVNGQLTMTYIVMHSSGEWISASIDMNPVKNDPQGVGSVITYMRRYTLASVTGVATEDDDGNAASGAKPVSRTTEDIPIASPANGAAAPKTAKGIVSAEPQTRNTHSTAEPVVVSPGSDDKRKSATAVELPPVESTLVQQAEANVSPKPGALPADHIEDGQASNFERMFKDALKPQLRKRATELSHEWLEKQGIVDGNGTPTAKAILKQNFYEVREQAILYAKELVI